MLPRDSDDGLQDAWSDAQPGLVAPMFPLPNVFLFPSTLMPLHIFEPRYRQMIEDSLDGPGRIVMATVLDGHDEELAGSPPVHHIAGLGEIARHERLPDGRFLIVLAGLARVLIREVQSDRMYRKVEAVPVRETPVPKRRARALRTELERAIRVRCSELPEIPSDMPLGHLADFLLLRLQLPQKEMQALYSCASVEERARKALTEHARRSPPPEHKGSPEE